MENTQVTESRPVYRVALFVLILAAIGGVSFAAGIAWSAHASELPDPNYEAVPGDANWGSRSPASDRSKGKADPNARVVYPKKTELDFEGLKIEGEVRNPGEFYFQHRNEEKFDSLVKRRKNFHKEMLRDAVLSK